MLTQITINPPEKQGLSARICAQNIAILGNLTTNLTAIYVQNAVVPFNI